MAATSPAGRHVPPCSLLDAVLAAATSRLGALWRWREFTIPSALLWFAGSQGGSLAFAAALAILAVLVSVAGLVEPDLVTGTVSRCRERGRRHRRQKQWPAICNGLHWYRKLEEGARLVPTLLSWEEWGSRIVVELRPLAEQASGSWDAMADTFRRYVGGASVEWREWNGTLTIVVGLVPLPKLLPYRGYEVPDGQLVLGERHGGELLILDSRTTPHVLLAGSTGSGKGGTIRAACAAALEAGWSVVVLDPKEAGEYAWLEPHGVPVVTSLHEQVAALERLERVRENRQATIKTEGVDSIADLPSEQRQLWRPVLLVVDEAADLLVVTKGKSDHDRGRAALQQKAGELVAELARKGRTAGIHLVVAIQRPDIAQLGEHGGSLRNNLTAKLALGRLDADGLRMLGLSANDPAALALDGTQGRGVCVGFAGDPRPSVCQVAWLDGARARSEIQPAWTQGLSYIGPADVDGENHV